MMPKDKILFYLRRRVRELESDMPHHESAMGVAQAAVRKAEEQREQNRAEIAALTDAILLVEKHAAQIPIDMGNRA